MSAPFTLARALCAPLLLASAALALAATPAKAADLLVDQNGRLIGAKNVDVGGQLYDVEFRDGSFSSIFGTTVFFNTEAAALAASQSLLDSVFTDGPLGNFDSQPGLTMGCTDPSFCWVNTPWDPTILDFDGSLNVMVTMTDNRSVEANDVAFAEFFGGRIINPFTYDLSSSPTDTYAVWSSAVAPIPEPGTYALMGLGLLAVSALSRRRQARTPAAEALRAA